MNLEKEVKILQEEVEKIKERNQRVEADKGWETSKIRTAFIALVTFVLVFIFMEFSPGQAPLPNALFAVIAYWISTETYGILKNWWLNRKKA